MTIKWLILTTLFAIANSQFGVPSFGGPASQAARGGFPSGVAKGFGNAAKTAAGAVPPGLPKVPLSPEELLNNDWLDFGSLFNKTYATPELAEIAKNNFITNRLSILKFNENALLNGFKLKLNSFSDLVLSEFNKIFNGFIGGNIKKREPPYTPSGYSTQKKKGNPESVDWRQKGGVTSVKYQSQCASCHAFSAAGAVEGHHFRKTGKLVELSPQNLLDCPQTLNYQNFGCKGGGYVDEDLKYIWKNPGINQEASYTYEGVDGSCRYKKADVNDVKITGYVEIPEGDEKALEDVVANLGPVAVGIDASHTTFQFYSEGIYYEKECGNKGANINHAMLIVGYGKEGDKKHWIVKNSYGPQWGEDGYIRIAKDKNNHCGIATSAVYPLV